MVIRDDVRPLVEEGVTINVNHYNYLLCYIL